MNMDPNTTQPGGLMSRLDEKDRDALGEALQRLLTRGSILGLERGNAELYAWCRQNLDWLKETAGLAGLEVRCEHESRLVQAIPKNPALFLRLKQDATLVLLALWYEYDTQVRDQGVTDVHLTVEQLNQLLKDKLLPDLKSIPSESRMEEILRLAQQKNLIRVHSKAAFEQSRIDILPTLKRVIPFRDLAEWSQTVELHRQQALEAGSSLEPREMLQPSETGTFEMETESMPNESQD
jgi:Domain of unknown function (DUF4194)